MKSNARNVSKNRHPFRPLAGDLFSLDQMTEEMLLYCLRELQAESASLFLTRNNKVLQLVKAVGSRENQHCGEVIALGEGVSGYVAVHKKPILVADLSQKEKLVRRKQEFPVDTFMSCPILNGSSVLGVINVSGRKDGGPFARRDLKKLQTISERSKGLLSQVIAHWNDFHGGEPKRRETEGPQVRFGDIEKHLEEIRNYNASILRCLSQHILIFDREFNITYCSKEKDLGRLFGHIEGMEIPKQSILELPIDVERDKLKERLEDLLGSGTPFSLNDVKIKDSPKTRIVNMFFSPFCTADGDLLGGLLLMNDNTKNFELQQRLVEAEKFSLIGSLTSMITHEVNNPLDGVMRLINLSLSLVEKDDPVSEYLNEAQKGLQRIASLVRSLLSFSRKSASLDGEYSHLNAIIENSASVVRNGRHSKDISLHLNLSSENPKVRTNDFYQILSNLLSNSFDAITSDHGNVTLKTEVEGDNFHLIVADDGCGIPNHMQSHIFNSFWTTKDYGKGTGLGLAIVKKIVGKYDGTIEVKSEESAGTQMHLTFPLAKLSV